MYAHTYYIYIYEFIKELYIYIYTYNESWHLKNGAFFGFWPLFPGLGHAAVSWKDLGGLATRWLFSVRKAVGEPESKTESQFAEEVSQAGMAGASNQKNGGKDGGGLEHF